MDCSTRLPCPLPTPWVFSHFMSIESLMPSNHLILCRDLLLLPSLFPSIKVFSSESVLHIWWTNYWSFNSVLPMNIQDWFPLRLTSLISLQSKRLSRIFSNTTVQKHKFFSAQLSLWSNSHIHMWLLEKSELWLYRLCWYCLCFVIWCLGWSYLFFQEQVSFNFRLQSPSAVIREPKKIKSLTIPVSLSICHEVMGLNFMILVFWKLSFKPTFHSPLSTFTKSPFSSSSLSAIRVVSFAYVRLLMFLPAILQLVLHLAWYFRWCTLHIN